MTCAIAAFTARGMALARTIAKAVDADVFAPERYAIAPARPMAGGLRAWMDSAFDQYEAFIFVGAAGIAVRAIAPHVRDKTTDPAVVVVDERRRYAIPILSGHIGGANELAARIAHKIGAAPVLTTATDINGVPAIDIWATKTNIAIENPGAIKEISAAALNGREVGVMITERTIKPPFPVTLTLRPRTLAVGIGCKRGISSDALEKGLCQFLTSCGVSLLSVEAFATIDLKKDETALIYLSEKYRIPLITYTEEELRAVPGAFSESKWVEKTVGVGTVCERAAVLRTGGRLLVGKTIIDGATFALSGEDAV